MTIDEVAERLNVAARWVRAHQQELPMVKIGAFVRFDPDLLEEWIAEQYERGGE
jgi:excisionase family DNA binding protein